MVQVETKWGRCAYVIVHVILPPSPVIPWIDLELGGKPKWLPLNFGYYDVMRTTPITIKTKNNCWLEGKFVIFFNLLWRSAFLPGKWKVVLLV